MHKYFVIARSVATKQSINNGLLRCARNDETLPARTMYVRNDVT